jgi:hypothetical protein
MDRKVAVSVLPDATDAKQHRDKTPSRMRQELIVLGAYWRL